MSEPVVYSATPAPDDYDGPVVEHHVYRSIWTKNIIQVPQGPPTARAATLLASLLPGKWMGLVVADGYVMVLDAAWGGRTHPYQFGIRPGQQIVWSQCGSGEVHQHQIGTTSIPEGEPLLSDDAYVPSMLLRWPLED